MQMCSVRAGLKVRVPHRPLVWLADVSGRSWRRQNSPHCCTFSLIYFPSFLHRSRHHGLSTWQSCSPGYFQPHHPLWRLWPESNGGIRRWRWVCALHVSTHHVKAFYVYHFTTHWNYFYIPRSRSKKKKKKTWHFNPAWFVCDTSEFSLLPHLSGEFECLSPCLSPPCQTGALTQGCWSKWKRWSCRASLQQRPGICKVHFNCSARQLSSCLGEPQLITTEHRPCGCEGTQRVPATDSTVNHSKRHSVRHVRLSSLSPATPHQPPSCQPLRTGLWYRRNIPCCFSLRWQGHISSEDMREGAHLHSGNSGLSFSPLC